MHIQTTARIQLTSSALWVILPSDPVAGSHSRRGQVERQGVFTDKMHDLGWTRVGFFDSREDEVALKHCIARYHA